MGCIKVYYGVIADIPSEACPEVVAEFDGIRYRAQVTVCNARRFEAHLLEPFEDMIGMQLPMFVVGLTGGGFVRQGRPSPLLERFLRSRLEGIHQNGRLRADLQAAQATEGDRLRALVREAQKRIAALEAERSALVEQRNPLADRITKEASRLRRAIQKGMKEGAIGRDEGRDMLLDHKAIEAAAHAAHLEASVALARIQTQLAEIEAEEQRVHAEFEARTGFVLKRVAPLLEP